MPSESSAAPHDSGSDLPPEEALTPPRSGDEAAPSGPPPSPVEARTMEPAVTHLARTAEAMVEDAKVIRQVAKALAPLVEESWWKDLPGAARRLGALRVRFEEVQVGERELALIEAAFDVADGIHEARQDAIRRDLARDLAQAAEAADIPLEVLKREEPIELRLDPFTVTIDRRKGEATFRYARVALGTAPAFAEDILAQREAMLESLDAGFDAAAFHAACRRAWTAARALAEDPAMKRVRLNEFLPHLALQQSLKKERVPLDRRLDLHSEYGPAHLAWDLRRLAEEDALEREGWRLHLGPPPGKGAPRASTLLHLEGETGDEEPKLTIWFERARPGGS